MRASLPSLALAALALPGVVFAAPMTICNMTETVNPAVSDEVELQLAACGAGRKAKLSNLIEGMRLEDAKTTCVTNQGFVAAAGEVSCVDLCLEDGTNCPAAGATTLDGLTDVAVAGQAVGECLVSDGANWTPSAAAVCLANGTNCPASPAHALDDLTDVSIAGAVEGGGLLYDGASWSPSASAICLDDGTNCPTVALDDLVNTTGADAGEGVVFGGIGWVVSTARVCLEDGTNCPAGATTLDALTDVDTAGQAAGEALVSNGTTWAPSAATVCLSDGTNCPAAAAPGWIDEAGALAASDGVVDWLSVATSVLTVDTNADGTAELLISRSSDRGQILAPSGSNLAIGTEGNSTTVIRANAADLYYINSNGFYSMQGSGFILKPGPGTVSAPNLVPNQSDDDTGFRADGTNTAFVSCGGETCASFDNDGTNHVVTLTGDTGQTTANVLTVQTSAAALRFGVDAYGPTPPTYTTPPACGSKPYVIYDDSGAFCGCVPGTGWTLLGGVGLCS